MIFPYIRGMKYLVRAIKYFAYLAIILCIFIFLLSVFGLVGIIRRMKTVRSSSASPWTNVAEQAEAMGGDFVMLRKPNPAYVRAGYPEIDAVRREIRETLRACRASGTPVAFVLKDVTTAAGRPEGIGEWVRLVESEIENY